MATNSYKDLLGQDLVHGDLVFTIEKNGRAVGGDLIVAKFNQPDVSKSATFEPLNGGIDYGLYKNAHSCKCVKLTNEQLEIYSRR